MGHSEASKRPRFPGCPLRGFQPSGSYPQATDSGKGSGEGVLRRVLRRGSSMGFTVKKGSEKGSQKGF